MMEAFTALTAVAAPIDLPNVDTDRIIPARFLRKSPGPGYEQYLFHDVRFDDDGRERPEFLLNQPAYRPARTPAPLANFGFGSSRQAAAWVPGGYGVRSGPGPVLRATF